MRHYEIMIILDPSLEDRDARAAVERLLASVPAEQATVRNVDHWGKRRLAYEIGHRTEGFYVVADIDATPEGVDELSRVLGLADSVVRHKVMRPAAA